MAANPDERHRRRVAEAHARKVGKTAFQSDPRAYTDRTLKEVRQALTDRLDQIEAEYDRRKKFGGRTGQIK